MLLQGHPHHVALESILTCGGTVCPMWCVDAGVGCVCGHNGWRRDDPWDFRWPEEASNNR
jgi:hypothetical protein